jgi:type II secretory pathway pseudopilin PulG
MAAENEQTALGLRIVSKKDSGFTLVEAMVASVLLAGLSLVILRGSIVALNSLRLDRLRLGSINQIQQQIETIRGMDYYRMGIGPNGVGYINHTVTENDSYDASNDTLMNYTVLLSDMGTTDSSDDVTGTLTTSVRHVDDAWDGIGVNDTDGDSNDYKRVRVEMTWADRGEQSSIVMESLLYGIVDDDSEYEAEDLPDPPGDEDPATVEVIKAEYNVRKSELKVEACQDVMSVHVLLVDGYGSMTYDSKKKIYKYTQKPATDPGATVTVRTWVGGVSDTHPVKRKK